MMGSMRFRNSEGGEGGGRRQGERREWVGFVTRAQNETSQHMPLALCWFLAYLLMAT